MSASPRSFTRSLAHSPTPAYVIKVISDSLSLDKFMNYLLSDHRGIPSESLTTANKIRLKQEIAIRLHGLGEEHVRRFASKFHGSTHSDGELGSASGVYRSSDLWKALVRARQNGLLVTESSPLTGVSEEDGVAHLEYNLWLEEEGDDMGSEQFIALARKMGAVAFPARYAASFEVIERTVDLNRVVPMSAPAIAMLMWLVNHSEVKAHGNMNDVTGPGVPKDPNTARRRYGQSLWGDPAKRAYARFLTKVRLYLEHGKYPGASPRLVLPDDDEMARIYTDLGFDVVDALGSDEESPS